MNIIVTRASGKLKRTIGYLFLIDFIGLSTIAMFLLLVYVDGFKFLAFLKVLSILILVRLLHYSTKHEISSLNRVVKKELMDVKLMCNKKKCVVECYGFFFKFKRTRGGTQNEIYLDFDSMRASGGPEGLEVKSCPLNYQT